MTSAFLRDLASAQWPISGVDLASRGITRLQTRGRSWRRTSRGYFVPAGTPESVGQRILDAAPLILPAGAVAGWAAAFVHGVDLLDGLAVTSPVRTALDGSLWAGDRSKRSCSSTRSLMHLACRSGT